MFALLLQDWVTVRSGSGGAVTQGEPAWRDTSSFLDLVVFIETKNFAISAGNLMMALQTAPTKDEVLFQGMNDVSNATGTPVAVGVQTFVMLRDTALCPLAHWLRWQLGPPPTNPSGATSFEATFRVWASLNQPGGIAREMLAGASTPGDQEGYGGGVPWTQGPAVDTGFHGGIPGTAPWSPIISDLNKRQTVVLGKAGRGSVNSTQGPAPSPHTYWWEKMKAPVPKPNDWKHRVQQVQAPLPLSRVPYVPVGKKVTE
jgi:hypothetical protein